MTGTVTFLLTDVQQSTQLWERDASEMRLCLQIHDEIIARSVREHNGELVKERGEGDSHFATFDRAADALLAAVAIQKQVSAEQWSTFKPIKVRIALHSGETEEREGDFYGHVVNKAARLRSIAHGGQTLLSLATRELVYHQLPKGVWLEDLGEHRLKDLLRAEQVFQLSEGTLQTSFPALNSLDAKRHNFPLQLTSFVGREIEISHINGDIQENRLTTLVGPGGCGKTRLALQVAAEAIDEFEDGAWLIDLVAVEDPESVVRTAAASLGIEQNPARDIGADLATFLAPKQILIVLDNCEHLGRAPGKLCDLILKSSPNCRILATSRRSVGLPGECLHSVVPLTIPTQDTETAHELLTTESARLMADRAFLRVPGFRITNANANAFAALCIELEGIPLAIELAAARLKILSPEQLHARLSKRLDLLKSASDEVDPRHRTLRLTIDWSFSQLSESEKEALKRLSVVPAGCPLELAESLCGDAASGDADVLDLLESLVDNSLVQVELAEEPRYRMLESIRQYCAEILDGVVRDKLHELLYRWAVGFAREGKAKLLSPEYDIWLKRFDLEYENLNSCLSWSAEQPGDENLLLQLVGDLDRYWLRKGMVVVGGEWMARALERQGGDPIVRAYALRAAGVFASLRHDLATAETLLLQSLAIFQAQGDTAAGIGALCNLGIMYAEAKEWDRAKEHLLEAKRICFSTGRKEEGALILQNLGALEFDSENLAQARDYLTEALSVVRSLKNLRKDVLPSLYNNLASISLKEELSKEAIAFLRKGLDAAQELNSPGPVADLVFNVTSIAYREQHFEIAARLLSCVYQINKITEASPRDSRIAEMDRLEADLREELDSESLAQALATGRGMSLAEIIQYALAGLDLTGLRPVNTESS